MALPARRCLRRFKHAPKSKGAPVPHIFRLFVVWRAALALVAESPHEKGLVQRQAEQREDQQRGAELEAAPVVNQLLAG